MRQFRFPSSRAITVQLLGMLCLLFLPAQITLAQSDPTLSINDLSVAERDKDLFGYEFTVSLSAASTKAVSVRVTTQAGTASDNVDFGAGSIVLNIPAGQTSQTVTVFIIGDTVVEGNETFFVNLSEPVNATIADGQGKGTIIDDDTLFLLTQDNSQRGVALDTALKTRESFPIVANQNFFSSETRTRITVFAVGLKLAAGENASAVMATAEDAVGTIRPLTVEFVGQVPNMNNWLTQVVLKLNDQITTAGDVKVRISLHGVTSNAIPVAVTPQ